MTFLTVELFRNLIPPYPPEIDSAIVKTLAVASLGYMLGFSIGISLTAVAESAKLAIKERASNRRPAEIEFMKAAKIAMIGGLAGGVIGAVSLPLLIF